MYTIALYYKPHTFRGNKGHEDCPYNLRLSENRAEAEETLISIALNEPQVFQEGYTLLKEGQLIWESGDLYCDVGDCLIRIMDWKEFSKKANLNPDLQHAQMGALTESDLNDLMEYQ